MPQRVCKRRGWVAAAELFHPEAEWLDLAHAPDTPEVLHGVDSILAAWEQWTQVFDEFEAEVYEYIDADPWVICDTRWYGKGRGSAVGVDLRQADAYELKDGKVVRAVLAYPDTATALEAVGLPESAVSQENVSMFREAIVTPLGDH